MKQTLSILDLAPITRDGSAAESFRHSLALARQGEALGYRRYWLAEHHGMPGIASAATAVLMAHIAAGTARIRIGAGGVMLPNHSPLVIAEQFGTLESLHPGRIDLGLGRAPGSDQRTSRALRRRLETDPDEFPQDVLALMDYFSDEPQQPVEAVPGRGLNVPIWILGSSLFGAELAAALGLPYAFASHFAPQMLMPAIEHYRRHFRPSPRLAQPYVMLGYNVIAADTDDEARYLATSTQQAVASLRSGRPIRLPPPEAGWLERAPLPVQQLLAGVLACSAIGAPGTVADRMRAFIEQTQADELMINANIHDHDARLRSYAIAAEVAGLAPPAA